MIKMTHLMKLHFTANLKLLATYTPKHCLKEQYYETQNC